MILYTLLTGFYIDLTNGQLMMPLLNFLLFFSTFLDVICYYNKSTKRKYCPLIPPLSLFAAYPGVLIKKWITNSQIN